MNRQNARSDRALCRRKICRPALGLPVAFALWAAGFAGPALAEVDHSKHLAAPQGAPATPMPIKVSDPTLTNQHGQRVKFRSQALGDRIVIMDFVYTTCTTVCPVLTALLAQVQARLGERLGQDVAMVSVTVDPVRDTPARLKAYGAKHRVSDEWLWLTGPTTTVNDLLKELDVWAPDFTQHPSVVMVGDAMTNQWTRLYGFPSPDAIMAKVDELTLARSNHSPVASGR